MLNNAPTLNYVVNGVTGNGPASGGSVKCQVSGVFIQVLYRKYRPRTFGEVHGQEHVVRTLKGAILSGRAGHAYLFAGPRGTGKTTMARLFAKILNCSLCNGQQPTANNQQPTANNRRPATGSRQLAEPCNKCSNCSAVNEGRFMDLVEIDAASNRGIDEVRNIKESARVASSHGGKKIFIIDEAHMLTAPAFNALLKVLEEPPAHVVFILATTESHKMPDTILSRVQRFDFKKLARGEIERKLAAIAAREKFSIDEESIRSVAAFAGGSLRDAENILAKLADYTGGKITSREASEIMGIVPESVSGAFLDYIVSGRSREAIKLISDLYESGADLDNFSRQFMEFLRNKLVLSEHRPQDGVDPAFLARTLKVFIKARVEMKVSPIPQLPLELAIMDLTDYNKKSLPAVKAMKS